ncbi:BIIDXI-like protein At5g11420 [Humulus lupulus]|uniref:BIIDXI-like protein At5g11420 n=1 Tax=Humulus lupulus TaxID=3486 RepID=UPI002B417DFD|nr:BIIDXI-like protein At5g11420 [Humulus lupulus]
MLPQVFVLSLLLLTLASADLLQNPDFEFPPSNLPKDSKSPFVLLNKNNTIPGWTFEGTVLYVTADETFSLPHNGHAVQLGEDGIINQTFLASADYLRYVLTFTIAPAQTQNCSDSAETVISAPDSQGVFSLKQPYGKETWESYGHYLGSWGDGESINLVIQRQAEDSNSSSICWPVIDELLIKSMPKLVQGNGNLLLNGGFEHGPEFLNNSTEGILIESAPSLIQSPLQEWSVLGTVNYVDSKHFFVPQGNAAIEIVSIGIQTAASLKEGSSYNLEFILGDANNSCVKDFLVSAQAGSTVQNFTLLSSGTGSAKNFSMKFKADSSVTTISFMSYAASQTKNGILCGPVVDDVVLRVSLGMKPDIQWIVLVFLYLVAFLTFH